MTTTAGQLSLTIPVKGGKLNPSYAQKQAVEGYLAKRDGKAVVVKFSRPVVVRSNNQNRLYWGVYLTTLAESTGHTTEELHEVLKEMFLPRKFLKVGSVEKEVRKSTAELTTDEFNLYLQQVEAWSGSELGITFPPRS